VWIYSLVDLRHRAQFVVACIVNSRANPRNGDGMSDEPKKRSQGKGLSRTWMPVMLFTFVVFAAYQGAHDLPAQQPSPKPITLATLVDVMEAREKLADSVMLRWTDTHWYSPAGPNGFTSPCEMLFKGASMRYDSQILSFAGKDVSLVERVSSFDGNESRYRVGGKQPRGGINTEKDNSDAICAANLPLRLCFRPLAEPYNTLRRKTLKLLDERKTVDGHECVTVDDGHLRVYLDCDRDFVPVAFEGYVRGNRYMNGSLEYYRKQDAMKWVPKAFQVSCYLKAQGVSERHRGERVQTEIGAPLKDRDFALIFEPGTVVWDARTREEYRILSDGSKEPIQRRGRRRAPPK
jgi:hypothetical protein